MRYNKMARLVGALAAAVLVAACSTGANNPTSAPTLVPADPTAAPSVVPAAPGGMFTGAVHCRAVDAPSGVETGADYFTCYQAATDPRMAGTVDLAVWINDIPETADAPAFAAWGESTITNDQGSWICKEAGMGVYNNGVFVRDLACIGKGENIGLSAWLHAVTQDSAMNWGFIGWIAKT